MKTLYVILLALMLNVSAWAVTISKSFTATGTGAALAVLSGESFSYSVSGTFVGTVVLESSSDGGQNWVAVLSATGSASGTLPNLTSKQVIYRFECTAYTSGTVVTSVADADYEVYSFKDKHGTAVFTVNKNGVSVPGTFSVTGASTLTGDVAVINTSQGTDIASATTINLETATGNLVDVTGTTTITTVTLSQGHWRLVRFTGILTLTHGSSLVIPGAANIATAAGDYALFVGYASGVVRLASFQRGASLNATISGTQTLTNKTLTAPTITTPTVTSPVITGTPTLNAAKASDVVWTRNCNLTSAAATTPVVCLLDADVGASSTPILLYWHAYVTGATAWATTSYCVIADTTGGELYRLPVANLTANAIVGLWTAGIQSVASSAGLNGAGATLAKGLQVSCDANGTGSTLHFVLSGATK